MSKFDEFYKLYPRKPGPAMAKKKWAAMKLDPIADTIIRDVEQRIKLDATWAKGYIPQPQTYLNQRRWEGEIERAPEKDKAEPARVMPNTFDPGPETSNNGCLANRLMIVYVMACGPIGARMGDLLQAKNDGVRELDKDYPNGMAKAADRIIAMEVLVKTFMMAHRSDVPSEQQHNALTRRLAQLAQKVAA